MRTTLLAFALSVLTLMQTGCATGVPRDWSPRRRSCGRGRRRTARCACRYPREQICSSASSVTAAAGIVSVAVIVSETPAALL